MERRILDVGCGEGFGARALIERAAASTVLGVDADADALRGPGLRRLLRPVCADADRLPYRCGVVFAVVCLEVLEHLEDPENALREMSSVAGQVLLLSVPSQPFFSLANLLRGKNWATGGDDPDHRHAWRPGALVDLVSRHARVVGVHHSFPWLIVVARPQER